MKWNEYQQDVIDQMRTGRGHLLVSARAGTGKTTTVVAGARDIGGHVLMTAFNRSTRDALARKLEGTRVTVKTTHQLGFRLCGLRFKSKMMDDDPQKKGKHIARRIAADHNKKGVDYHASRAASMAKNVGLRHRSELLPICEGSGATFNIDFTPQDLERIVWDCLKAAKADTAHVDFDDMIWLPYIHNVEPGPRHSTAVVDELQDLNRVQTWLIDAYTAPAQYNGRIIGVGDERQAIYQFRGATGAFDWLREREPQERLMPVTYRCGRAIVGYARNLVDDIEAAPGAPEGRVHHLSSLAALAPEPGDVVLSRSNAPLMAAGMRLVRDGVPIMVKGRDFETKLRGLCEAAQRNGATTPGDIAKHAREWFEEQRLLLVDESVIATKFDQAGALVNIAEMCSSVDEVLRSIRQLFEAPVGRHVVLSTVHRFKGLEAPRIWLIEPSFLDPGSFAMGDDEDLDAEANVRYVAITRAMTDLFLVGKMRTLDRPAFEW